MRKISYYQERIIRLVAEMEENFGAVVAEVNVERGMPEPSFDGEHIDMAAPVVVTITFV